MRLPVLIQCPIQLETATVQLFQFQALEVSCGNCVFAPPLELRDINYR
jgi:hypothetical protein